MKKRLFATIIALALFVCMLMACGEVKTGEKDDKRTANTVETSYEDEGPEKVAPVLFDVEKLKENIFTHDYFYVQGIKFRTMDINRYSFNSVAYSSDEITFFMEDGCVIYTDTTNIIFW